MFQTGSSYITAVDRVVATKFGLLIDVDLLKTLTSTNTKPEVVLRCHDRHVDNRYDIVTPLWVVLFG